MAEEPKSRRKRHPIQVVARRTGLTPDLLRAWEKRYGVVEPGRSEGGRRLYSDEDVERLRLLRRATRAGRRIGRIAGLSTEQLAVLVREDELEEAAELGERPGVDGADAHLRAALESVRRFDSGGLAAVLSRARVVLAAPVLIEDVAVPLLRRVGELWKAGELRPAREHMLTAALMRVLGWMIEAAGPPRLARSLVVATPAGLRHELGAMFVAATAASEGWGVTYLGSDLPASDIASAAREVDAAAVALSIVYPRGATEVEDELRELRRRVEREVALLVGGEAADSYEAVLEEIGAILLSDMEGLRGQLRVLAGVGRAEGGAGF